MISLTSIGPVEMSAGDEQNSVVSGIALCLSGGGYRAMLFHVGSLWRLNEAGVLPHLKRISSVSRGSITSATLGLNWTKLKFLDGVAAGFDAALVQPIRSLASHTIDIGAVLGGILLPGSISDKVETAYDKHLFGLSASKPHPTLQDLPDDTADAPTTVAAQYRKAGTAAPRFVINATNIQTGSLWRFSKPYMGDYQIGLIRHPNVTLAKAVTASSAFPPILSPCRLNVDPGDFDPGVKGSLCRDGFARDVVLADGGVYDNLGLETAYKRYTTLLVSDGGAKMSAEEEPSADWARHAIRVLNVIDNQVRSLRKRQLIDAYERRERTGAFWGIASRSSAYGIATPELDPLGLTRVPQSKFDALTCKNGANGLPPTRTPLCPRLWHRYLRKWPGRTEEKGQNSS